MRRLVFLLISSLVWSSAAIPADARPIAPLGCPKSAAPLFEIDAIAQPSAGFERDPNDRSTSILVDHLEGIQSGRPGNARIETAVYMASFVLLGTIAFLTESLAWPFSVLAWMTPSHWHSALRWGGEGILLSVLVFAAFHGWQAFQTWMDSAETKRPRSLILRTAALPILVVSMPIWVFLTPARPHPEIRDKLAALITQARRPHNPALAAPRRLLLNIVTHGNITTEHDITYLFGVIVEPLGLVVSDTALRGEFDWVPQALKHELFHLTPEQIQRRIQQYDVELDAWRRVMRMINPRILARETANHPGELSLDTFISLGWLTPAMLKADPVLHDDVRRSLMFQFVDEIQAYHGATGELDAERPRGKSLQAFIADQLRPSAQAHGWSVPAWVAQYYAGNARITTSEGQLLREYELAPFYDRGKIIRAYERTVAKFIIPGGEMAAMVTLYARADFDRRFNIDRLTRTSPAAKQYRDTFYEWFRVHVLEGPEDPQTPRPSHSQRKLTGSA